MHSSGRRETTAGIVYRHINLLCCSIIPRSGFIQIHNRKKRCAGAVLIKNIANTAAVQLYHAIDSRTFFTQRRFRPSDDTSLAREKPTESGTWCQDGLTGCCCCCCCLQSAGLHMALQYFQWIREYLLQQISIWAPWVLLITNYKLHRKGNLFMTKPARTWEQNGLSIDCSSWQPFGVEETIHIFAFPFFFLDTKRRCSLEKRAKRKWLSELRISCATWFWVFVRACQLGMYSTSERLRM